MSNHDSQAASEQRASNRRGTQIGAITILISSILMIVAMTHHPSSHAHDMAEFADDVCSMNTINILVHGTAIGIMGLFIFGFSWLSSSLGWHRATVRAAMIAYSIGGLAMIVAAMVSGFIVPLFLERYLDASANDLEIASHVLGMLREVNRTFDLLGVFCMSAGVFLWSVAILNRSDRDWWSGGLGLVVGIVGIGGIFTGHTGATVAGIMMFAVLQGLWNIVVSIQMLSRKWP